MSSGEVRAGSDGKSGRACCTLSSFISLFYLIYILRSLTPFFSVRLCHVSRGIRRSSAASDGDDASERSTCHPSSSSEGAAPRRPQEKEHKSSAAAGGEGGTRLHFIPRVFVLACGAAAAAAAGKFPVLMMQGRQKPRQDGVGVGKRGAIIVVKTLRLRNDYVFSSRKVS